MKLLTLELTNFKGVKQFRFTPDGQSVTVLGPNASGKTSLYDGFLWLLFGKDSQQRTKFEIKPLDASGATRHGLDCTVEGSLLHDGRAITLKRVYREKWAKKTGDTDKVLTGDTTEYYIDGVSRKEGEYKAFIDSLIPESLFLLITHPFYFNTVLTWQKRREVMMEIVGRCDVEAVIAADPRLDQIKDLLSSGDIEDHQKRIAAERKKLNDDLEKIPIRIDELTRSLPEYADQDTETLRLEKEGLEADRASLTSRLREIEAQQQESRQKKRVQINTLESQIAANEKIVSDFRVEQEKRKTDYWAVDHKRQQVVQSVSQTEAEIKLFMEEQERLKAKLAELTADYKALRSSALVPPDVAEECPTCFQPLPPDQVKSACDKAHADAVAAYNARLQAINEVGQSTREQLKAVELRIYSAEESNSKAALLLEDIDRQLREIQRDIDATCPDFSEPNLRYRETIHRLVADLDSTAAPDYSDLLFEITQRDQRLFEINTVLSKQEQIKNAQGRIEILKAEERQLANELARLDGQLFLLNRYIFLNARLMVDTLNGLFKIIQFKLFEELQNGTLKETFVALINGVPFPDANDAAKINAGIEIINLLCRHYGVSAPIFIDQRESVTKLVPSESQLIGLKVDDIDALTMEVSR